ncbi:MAG: citramalate synthase [Peptococcaceae bacterium]|nr:citramalate synthase [Peptococcaceae bacterium]
MNPVIQIYDTTLRDGAQSAAVSFSVEDKLKITRRLDKLGVHYVEGGWPGSNPKDREYFRRIREYTLKHAKIAAFSSTRRANTKVEDDPNTAAILESKVQVATIFGKAWDFHVKRALQTTLEENLHMIRDTISYLKQQGLEVIFDAEHFFDGYKANPEYALATVVAAQESGAGTVVLCDTNGGSLPNEIFDIVAAVKKALSVPLGIHAHNDGALAVANSLMAVEAGAVQVQGTVNGFGERCGNADLCAVIPNLTLKKGFETIPRRNLIHLTDLSRYVYELANASPDPRQPFVGANAFGHKGGVHVSALMKDAQTYEHIDPGLVGNERRVLVSELSGLSNMVYKYRELNFGTHDPEETRKLLNYIKELEFRGFQFEGAEGSFELLLKKAFNHYVKPFTLESMRIITELNDNGHVSSEAIIKLRVKDRVVHTAAEGNGPVNAMDAAMRKALEEFFPAIKDMKLNDYKVRVLDEKAGTEAVVRVLIETGDGRDSWGTVGVSSNIIEASWQALVDSFAYGLLRIERRAGEGGKYQEDQEGQEG